MTTIISSFTCTNCGIEESMTTEGTFYDIKGKQIGDDAINTTIAVPSGWVEDGDILYCPKCSSCLDTKPIELLSGNPDDELFEIKWKINEIIIEIRRAGIIPKKGAKK